VVERMLAGEADRFDRKLLVIALHRALYYLGRVMLQTTLIYSPWPRNLWKDLNSLFAFAQQNRVHQVPIKMKLDDEEDISTIEDNYKALLIFAASTPYRMRQNHLLQLYKEARNWAPATELSIAEHETSSTGRFNINLLADEPPVHNALRSPASGRHVLVLDVRSLLKQLREDFESAPLDNNLDLQGSKRMLGRPLLRQLIIAWNQPPERRFVRTRLNFELNVLCGLQALYESIAEPLNKPTGLTEQPIQTPSPEPQFPTGASSPSPYPLSPDSALGTLSGDNLSLAPLGDGSLGGDSLSNDSYLNITQGPQSELNDDWTEEPSGGGGSAEKRATSLVTTRNESAGGYCIHWSSAENVPKVKVGELVGVASATQRKQFSLGVVRWMRLHAGKQLDLGLQVISNNVEAAQLRTANAQASRRSANPPVNCLLLQVADNDPSSDVASVILNNVSFPVGTNLLLSHRGRERMIRLTKLIEFSSAFAQFQFAYADHRAEAETEPSEGNGRNRFDDLWNNL